MTTFTANGMLKQLNDAADALNAVGGGLHVVRFTFDAASGNDDAGAACKAIGAHDMGVTIPANSIIVGGFVDVNTAFTSANSNNGTIAIKVVSANDIISAAAVSGAPWSTIGRKAILPKWHTPENAADVKTSAASDVTVTVAVSALTAGKFTGYLLYVTGIVSA